MLIKYESRVRHYPTLSKEEKKRNSLSGISVASAVRLPA